MTCRACVRTDTRRYLTGDCCPSHTPAASAGRPEPVEHDASWIGRSFQTPVGALGGSDINKTRSGGYTSRQKAKRISETRDAIREHDGDEAANIIYRFALTLEVLSMNECRAEFDRLGIKEGARGNAFGMAVKRGWLRHCGSVKSTAEKTKNHRLSAYTSLVYERERAS